MSAAVSNRQCIYCRSGGPFNTVDHVVPESLGNKTETLAGAVCDKCQNYFAREVERPALEKTPIAVWRAHLGIMTKAGKDPKADLRPPKTPGAFGKGATAQSGMTLESNADHVKVEFFPPQSVVEEEPGRLSYNFTITPWVLSVMTRFLGKMALGLTQIKTQNALDPIYDDLRSYVRQGDPRRVWPLFWVQHGEMKDLVSKRMEGDTLVISSKLYGHGLLQGPDGPIYLFVIGTDHLMIALNHRNRDLGVRLFDLDKDPLCVWLEDGSW